MKKLDFEISTNKTGSFRPKLAMCNFIEDLGHLKSYAVDNGFDGIDWSFDKDNLPSTPADESRWVEGMAILDSLEIRYHCPFSRTDLGHTDPEHVEAAERLFQRVIRLASKAGGQYLSLHVGLGNDTTHILSWNETLKKLRQLVRYGMDRGVTVCLENLAWGWTSRPNLFEKMVRKTGAGVTFDIGHALVCEAVLSHQYKVEDFVTPHLNRVFNAHVYHEEIPGRGHLAPESVEDIQERLDILHDIRCHWWVIELKENDSILKTKKILDEYLSVL